MRTLIRDRRASRLLLALCAVLGLACDDSSSPPRERPLTFVSFIRPAVVFAGGPFTIDAGVVAGPTLCWQTGQAWATVTGNVIELRGTAVAVPGRVCAQAIAQDSVTIGIPALEPGTYVLEADGLVDSLLVVNAIPIELPRTRFAALGVICPPSPGKTCSTFDGAILQRLRGWVAPSLSTPPACMQWRVYGEITVPQPCDGMVRPQLILSRAELTEGQPVLFEYFLHPGVLDENTSTTIRAGMLVGPNGCWKLAHAGLVNEGDALVLYGMATYDASGGECPGVAVYDTLSAVVPPLPAGRYAIVAGSLVDTLVVRTPAPRPSGSSFAARGCVNESDPACVTFTCSYPEAKQVDGVLVGFTPEPHVPGCEAIVVGTRGGPAACGPPGTNALRVRSLQWLAGPD